MFKSILLASLLVVAGFGGAVAMRLQAVPPHEPLGTALPEPVIMSGTADGACKSELANAKAQLAICLAFRAAPAPTPPPNPTDEVDEETARLVRTHTTNAELVLVQLEGRTRSYAPGTWPPPGGPPIGARLVGQKVDGGMEYHWDGRTTFVPVPSRPLFCPCPQDPLDGGAEGGGP